MRALGPGSVSSFLKIILDVVYYALWVLIGAAALFALVALLFSFNPGLLAGWLPLSGRVAAIVERGPFLASALIAVAAYMGGVLAIVGILRRIFVTLTAGDPFHPENVRRLRLVGVILGGLEIGRYLLSVVLAMMTPDRIRSIDGSLNLTTWFAVLVILVLAEVFREGARLRNEAELTI
ncbi:MAG TPA: DUF2975 domain-containing protein [Caulobacter sp.]|nr:DUF2975 domain-containing protein [Caulobacter sp.]